MATRKKGRQTPTQSVVLPYTKTKGPEAVRLYNSSKRKALEWQKKLINDIMAVNKDGQWVHQKFGYSVPRRNGKNEIIAIRELWGLENGQMMCHTAHRTTTSHSAWVRLIKILTDAGYTELGRKKKDEVPVEKGFRTTKQYGLESIVIEGKGEIVFRTRTPNGGLGEGFDLLVIDEAQEYTDEQQSALIYTVSDSSNPQTIFCGTPPTATSSGTVFTKMRNNTLHGDTYETGWAEWSIPDQTDDVYNTANWYETNPSMGAHLDERKIRAEIGDDLLDFNIQRLGVWLTYNQKSEITETEWKQLAVDVLPELKGKLFVGIKFGKDGANVAMSIAVKTATQKIFVETIDCQSVRNGYGWIIRFLKAADVSKVIIDGANGQNVLAEQMQEERIKVTPILPTVKEIIDANTIFRQGLDEQNICHRDQPSLTQSVSNCEKRMIGTNGGYGYKSLKEGIEISLLDSVILAYWQAKTSKERRKQRISY